MRELREDTFSGNKNDDAREHVERILDIDSLFNIPGVTHDAVMLRVFPITLIGAVKRWVDRLPLGTINTLELLKKAFIQRYCPPSKTAKHLEEIHNFKQEGDETLYQAWERYNVLLYKCPTHDLNSDQKVNIFYNRLDTMTHQLLDSQGPIPNKTHAQALDEIQTMSDHSQKWHDRSTSTKDVKPIEELTLTKNVHFMKRSKALMSEKKSSLKELINKHLEESKKTQNRRLDEKASGEHKFEYKKPNASLKNLETQIEQLAKYYQAKETDEVPPGVLICQLPPKELSPGSFTLPCTIGDPNENMILGRPFLATIHARIDVLNKEISRG
nr:hypothetical protein [Tanacetum cinerariifolium]